VRAALWNNGDAAIRAALSNNGDAAIRAALWSNGARVNACATADSHGAAHCSQNESGRFATRIMPPKSVFP
jgi:hypothetical protein